MSDLPTSELGEANAPHDGITEHDNHLPNWWLLTLFGAIAFSAVYWAYYHTLSLGALQRAELAASEKEMMQQRAAAMPPVDEATLVRASADPNTLSKAKAIYATNCVACHGARGEGGVGPNLTDSYWLHGGKPLAIHQTINNGVVDKGMLAWGPIIGPEQVRDVTALVLSWRHTNVEGGKAPQGSKE